MTEAAWNSTDPAEAKDRPHVGREAPSSPVGAGPIGMSGGLLDLQRTAGNRAVSRAIQRATAFKVSNSTYSVSGTLHDAANSISGRTEAGSVTSQATSINTTPDAKGKVQKADVEFTESVELPTWTSRKDVQPSQEAEWNRFFAAVSRHEANHLAKDKAGLANAHAVMIGKTSDAADAALDAKIAATNAAQDAYDSSTNHGISEGTGINPNAGTVTKVP